MTDALPPLSECFLFLGSASDDELERWLAFCGELRGGRETNLLLLDYLRLQPVRVRHALRCQRRGDINVRAITKNDRDVSKQRRDGQDGIDNTVQDGIDDIRWPLYHLYCWSCRAAQLLPPPRIALRVALLNDLCHAAAVLATDAALVAVAMLLLISHQHHTTRS